VSNAVEKTGPVDILGSTYRRAGGDTPLTRGIVMVDGCECQSNISMGCWTAASLSGGNGWWASLPAYVLSQDSQRLMCIGELNPVCRDGATYRGLVVLLQTNLSVVKSKRCGTKSGPS